MGGKNPNTTHITPPDTNQVVAKIILCGESETRVLGMAFGALNVKAVQRITGSTS